MSISPKQQPLFIRSQLCKANGRSPTRRVEFLIEVHPASAIAKANVKISIFTLVSLVFTREALSCQSAFGVMPAPIVEHRQ
jgi:hypothetical protein